MGNSYLGVKLILDSLEIPVVLPNLNNKKTLDIGCRLSPEEICLPFKLMLGNIIEGIEKGADTVIVVGSCGPCRLGEYCELQMDIINQLGFKVDFIVIDTPEEIGTKEFLNRISRISSKSKKSKFQKLLALKHGGKIIKLIEELEAEAKLLSGYALNPKECVDIIKKCKLDLIKLNNSKAIIQSIEIYKSKLSKVKLDKTKNPIKISIIGEIYTIIEPFSNINVEERLMLQGVSVMRRITPNWWLKDTLLKPFKLNSLDINRASKKYIPYSIGGFAKECIGEAVLTARNNFDGAIQIFPMGCMPEIVSKSILPTVSKDLNLPIMSIVMDEITGDAGYITRIEAFLDLLERRRRNVLYGN